MTRFIQIHALTVYAPSNLNRDDTGRPKTARFGGAERLRISSQALKRAIRTSEAFRARVAGNRGERTQRLGDELRRHLESKGLSADKAIEGARAIAGVCNEARNVVGLMPHPERAAESELGSADGRRIFEAMIRTLTLAAA